MAKKDIISLEELLSKFNNHNKKFIGGLENEDALENVGELSSYERKIENEVKALTFSNELKKKEFINELKKGLGDEVRTNPGKIHIVEKSFKQRLKQRLTKLIKKIFNKF